MITKHKPQVNLSLLISGPYSTVIVIGGLLSSMYSSGRPDVQLGVGRVDAAGPRGAALGLRGLPPRGRVPRRPRVVQAAANQR